MCVSDSEALYCRVICLSVVCDQKAKNNAKAKNDKDSQASDSSCVSVLKSPAFVTSHAGRSVLYEVHLISGNFATE